MTRPELKVLERTRRVWRFCLAENHDIVLEAFVDWKNISPKHSIIAIDNIEHAWKQMPDHNALDGKILIYCLNTSERTSMLEVHADPTGLYPTQAQHLITILRTCTRGQCVCFINLFIH